MQLSVMLLTRGFLEHIMKHHFMFKIYQEEEKPVTLDLLFPICSGKWMHPFLKEVNKCEVWDKKAEEIKMGLILINNEAFIDLHAISFLKINY